MKKLLLVAAVGVVGLMSANTIEESIVLNDNEETVATCIQYAMVFSCEEENTYYDTVCYGEGTDVPTYRDAKRCMDLTYSLLDEQMCP